MGPCFRRDDVSKGSIHFKHASPPRGAYAPELLQELPPRGRGECRMPDAPAASCAHIGSEYAHEYSQRATGTPGIPARNGFNGFLRALLGDRACLSPSPAESRVSGPTGPTSRFRRLDASVGASGPHDFAVRRQAPSSEALPASTASRPAFVTIAIRPSSGARQRSICD
jgi:hypothetical protein